MARQLLGALARALPRTDAEREVHLHSGPAGRPYACHDARCAAPRLDPRDA
jgi:hypothetical protein